MAKVSILTIPMQVEVVGAERVSLCNFLVFETPIKINDLSKMPL
jgi:hypothetical protein